jgi:hypothetical protein
VIHAASSQRLLGITNTKEGAEEEHVEWNISNKYYTAKVQFHRAAWRALPESLKPGIPAVVVIWEKGEVREISSIQCACLIYFKDYEYILGRYTTEWEALNAEVKLAVAVGQGTIDTETMEDFCSEVGFEFVDAGDELAKDGSESS